MAEITKVPDERSIEELRAWVYGAAVCQLSALASIMPEQCGEDRATLLGVAESFGRVADAPPALRSVGGRAA